MLFDRCNISEAHPQLYVLALVDLNERDTISVLSDCHIGFQSCEKKIMTKKWKNKRIFCLFVPIHLFIRGIVLLRTQRFTWHPRNCNLKTLFYSLLNTFLMIIIPVLVITTSRFLIETELNK